jgi:Leucine-rich repeat (LRR) protein
MIEVAKRCSQLHFLNGSQCYSITNISVRWLIKACPNLKDLYLQSCGNIVDIGIPWGECLKLEKLDLSGNHLISDCTVQRLAKRCHNLKYLGLIDCPIVSVASVRSLPEGCYCDYECDDDSDDDDDNDDDNNNDDYG